MTCKECSHCHGARKKIIWGDYDSMAFECPASGEYSYTYWHACGHFRPVHAYTAQGAATLRPTPGGPATQAKENGPQISGQARVREGRGHHDSRHGLRCQREHDA